MRDSSSHTPGRLRNEMRHMSLNRRIELCFALIVVVALLAAVGAIQLQQRIFYHRAAPAPSRYPIALDYLAPCPKMDTENPKW
jgi:hypothetical protein